MGLAWRVCSGARARTGDDAFSGEGAFRHGGRWNSKGVAVAYGSATLSLAALEYLVHADVPRLSTIRLVSCDASWPDDLNLDVLAVAALPKNWRDTPAPAALAALGDRWARERKTAILIVPSAIVPSENNFLINRDHPDAARIVFGAPKPFGYDARLL